MRKHPGFSSCVIERVIEVAAIQREALEEKIVWGRRL